jgi:hypothetical protein
VAELLRSQSFRHGREGLWLPPRRAARRPQGDHDRCTRPVGRGGLRPFQARDRAVSRLRSTAPAKGEQGPVLALTGVHLAGSPHELHDITAEYARTLANFEAKSGKPDRTSKTNGHAVEEPEPAVGDNADGILAALLENDRDFAAAWDAGVKIGPGSDDSASGRDFSLAVWLKRAGVTEAAIAALLRRYPHGQIGSGKLRGRLASRRIARILADLRNGGEDDPRPVIQLAGGFLHAEVDRAERELGRVGNVYQRGAMLVRVARVTDPASGGIRRAADAVIIITPLRSLYDEGQLDRGDPLQALGPALGGVRAGELPRRSR